MRFMSIALKIKLHWKKNFLLQNYLIYDLQAGTEVRQSWGREHLILLTAVSGWNEEFRGMILERSKVQTNLLVCVWVQPSPLFFTDVSQPVTAPRGSSCLQWIQTHSRDCPSQRGPKKSCKNASVPHICCAGGSSARAHEKPMKSPAAAALAPWPCPGHCWPWGALCKSGTTPGSWPAMQDATAATKASPGFWFCSRNLEVVL